MNDVFTYFDAARDETLPAYLDLCQQTMRRHCMGDMNLHILDRDSVRGALNSEDTPDALFDVEDGALRTAFVRAAILARRGGLWLDADSLVLKSPSCVFEKAAGAGLAACEREPERPLTSFIAAAPGNEVIRRHLDRVRESLERAARRRAWWHRLLRPSRQTWATLERIPSSHRYFAYPPGVFAPVLPADAGVFFDRSKPIGQIVGEASLGVSLRGLSDVRGAIDISRDELLNAGFLVSRLFRRALGIGENQRHRAYDQVSVHKQVSGSWSGPGSTVEAAREIIEFLPRIIEQYSIKTIGDMPCGDWMWMKEVDLSGVDYTGYDIVEFLIEQNRKKYPQVRFEILDLLNEDIGRFDLIICRDFLFHISNRDAVSVLRKFQKSGSTFLLTTTFDDLEENTDLPDGQDYGYREINLKLPPFNMGDPVASFRETHIECHGRLMALYKLR